jgi:uncharacterized protein
VRRTLAMPSLTWRKMVYIAVLGAFGIVMSFNLGRLDRRRAPVSESTLEAASAQSNTTASTPSVELDWDALAGLDYRTGKASELLRRVDGKRVKVPGYIVPLEDDASRITEFLLVPYFGACVHYPPPPPNQIVHVKLPPGKPTSLEFWLPVWIEGTLRIESYESPYGTVGFRIAGEQVTPYTTPIGR